MTSSENLASIEPWAFRSAFADSWFSDAFARDTETLTKALQKSFTNNTTTVTTTTNNNNNNDNVLDSDFISPFLNPETPTVSNVSGSEPETTAPKRQTRNVTNSGKITKRKSRASKRTQTTFITADPANFRQMVQQVTGVRFGNSSSVAPILKPEPQRIGSRLSGIGGGVVGCLPTLDTSAFLLDHHQQQMVMGQGSNGPAGVGHLVGSGSFSFQGSTVADGGGAALDFESFPSFPTLESWKVM